MRPGTQAETGTNPLLMPPHPQHDPYRSSIETYVADTGLFADRLPPAAEAWRDAILANSTIRLLVPQIVVSELMSSPSASQSARLAGPACGATVTIVSGSPLPFD